MHVDNFFFSMQSVDEVRHHAAAERSRAIERDRRDQIDESLRLQILDKIRHTRRFHLKHCARIAIAQHLCSQIIFEWNIVDINVDPVGLADIFKCIFNDAQRPQP